MQIDFSAIDFHEQPTLVLKNLSGTAIAVLGYAFNVKASINYNEVSELSFDIPASVDGASVEYYDKLVGKRIVEAVGYGQFILQNPSEKNDGSKRIKSCKAYSLEYEFCNKKITLAEGTYCFYSPYNTGTESIISILLEKMPSWSVGTIDSSLWGRYRTFSVDNENEYNFIKNTLQESYGCIFTFDTMLREISATSIESSVATEPVYLSFDNLLKEVSVEENSDGIVTYLNLYGADEVDVRSVNPTGKTGIYDLSYFMTTDNASQDIVDAWTSWQADFNGARDNYYNLNIDQATLYLRLEAENAKLTDMQGVLQDYKNQEAVELSAIASGTGSSSNLATIRANILNQNFAISTQQDVISGLSDDIDAKTVAMKSIVDSLAFDTYFADAEHYLSADDRLVLDRYIIEDSLEDSTFVYPTVTTYDALNESFNIGSSTIFTICGAISSDTSTTSGGITKTVFTVRDGTLFFTYDGRSWSAAVARATLERSSTGSITTSFYLGNGSIEESGETDIVFKSGSLSISGSSANAISDTISSNGHELEFDITSGYLFFTENVTEYRKRSVEWELFEYGQTCLQKLAQPTYTFKIDSANFFRLDSFEKFKDEIVLGRKVYIRTNEAQVLQPIVIGVSVDFEDYSSLSFEMSDKFCSSDTAFALADLLEESISMGHKVNSDQFSYSAYKSSDISGTVSDWISSALDTAKNAIMSSTRQDIAWDSTGLKLRKQNSGGTGYEDSQIWMVNDKIIFTKDNWNTSSMVVGSFQVNGSSVTGIAAPALVGKMLIGESLYIESPVDSNNRMYFKVDSSGAKLNNASFDMYSPTGLYGHISLNPNYGIIGGYNSADIYTYDTTTGVPSGVKLSNGNSVQCISDWKYYYPTAKPNANFWIDMIGSVYLRGTIEATDGIFTGKIQANSGYIGSSTTGWTIGESMISNGTIGSDGGAFFSGANYSGTLAGTSSETWRLGIGDGFGVNSQGDVYMDDLYSDNITSDNIRLKTLNAIKNNGNTLSSNGGPVLYENDSYYATIGFNSNNFYIEVYSRSSGSMVAQWVTDDFSNYS